MKKIQIKEKLFGGEITILVEIKQKNTEEILLDAYKEALRLEKIFNFYDKESFVNNLNKKRKLEAPKEFIELLQTALKASKQTNGAYDITHGENYKKRKRGEQTDKLTCSADDVRVQGELIELTNKEAVLDFGSLAKGYITDKITDYLKKNEIANGIINARGDIRAFGTKKHEIAIANPRGTGSINNIQIQNEGIATSGDYEQNNGNYDENHIIGNKDYSSATVIAPTLTEADLNATILLVIGKDKAKQLLQEKKHLKALCITKNGTIETYNGFETLHTEEKEEEDEGPFKKEHLHKKGNRIGPVGSEGEDTRKIEEWHIDEPLPENAREIIVRPSKKYEKEFATKAS